MSEVENKKIKIESALRNEIQTLDRLYFRKLQKAVFECSAKCCENNYGTSEEVHRCVERCGVNLHETERFVHSELNNYQNRIQRCLSECNDGARDMMGASPSERQVMEASSLFEKCACKCIDKHAETLPQFMKKIHEALGKKVSSLPGADSPSNR